ncbi:MAG: hypothetical protein ACLUNQ_06610 [Oscillospiraceae bacterium]
MHSATVKLDYSTKIEGGIKKSKDYDVGKVWTEGQNVTNSLSSVIGAAWISRSFGGNQA